MQGADNFPGGRCRRLPLDHRVTLNAQGARIIDSVAAVLAALEKMTIRAL
jgi:hypothetical protein